jgi:hypothetical protein
MMRINTTTAAIAWTLQGYQTTGAVAAYYAAAAAADTSLALKTPSALSNTHLRP